MISNDAKNGRAHPSKLAYNSFFLMVSILAWNARGVGNSRKLVNLNRLMRAKAAYLVVIFETKCSSISFPLIRNF